MHLSRPSFKQSLLIALAITGLIFAGTDQAMAQTASFSGVQRNIAHQIAWIPKLIAVLAYAIGAFFAASGLLKLKDWINEPEKNPLNAVIFRMVVAALLIVLPHILIIVNGTIFGGQASKTGVNVSVPMQSLSTFKTAN